MKNIFRLILSVQIVAFGIQIATAPAEAQVLRPGDDVIITPDGRSVINPPLPKPTPAPRPTLNPDGSTTYPSGTTPPRTDGFTQVNPDGSVTIFPRGGTRTPPPLRPGDDAIITPDGRTIINPPLPTPAPAPRPTRNPDGSTTYPSGTTPPRTDGFTQVNPDGSVTIFPRDSAPSANQPDEPIRYDFSLPWRISDDLQIRARYDYFDESESPEPQEAAPSRDEADAPTGLDLRFDYPYSDKFQLRARYDYQPDSGAEDDSSMEPAPPTIEFMDEESPSFDLPESDGQALWLDHYRDRMDGGSVYIDPPTLDLDLKDEPPVESVIPELQNYGNYHY